MFTGLNHEKLSAFTNPTIFFSLFPNLFFWDFWSYPILARDHLSKYLSLRTLWCLTFQPYGLRRHPYDHSWSTITSPPYFIAFPLPPTLRSIDAAIPAISRSPRSGRPGHRFIVRDGQHGRSVSNVSFYEPPWLCSASCDLTRFCFIFPFVLATLNCACALASAPEIAACVWFVELAVTSVRCVPVTFYMLFGQ